MSLIGKAFSNYFKDLLHINNGNSGVDSTQRRLTSGDGSRTVLSISTDSLYVNPFDSNNSGVFKVSDKDSNSLFRINASTVGVSGSIIKDEDTMSSDSATHLCTQQSIKAYTDTNLAGKLDLTGGTMSGHILMGSAKELQFASSGHYIKSDGTDLIMNTTGDYKLNLEGGDVTITDVGSAEPRLYLINNDLSSGLGGMLVFQSYDDDDVSEVGEICGTIGWQGKNDANEVFTIASLYATPADVTDGTEDGNVRLMTMANGTLVSALDMTTNGNAVDVEIGGGVTSLTTVAGDIAVTGDIKTTAGATYTPASDYNIATKKYVDDNAGGTVPFSLQCGGYKTSNSSSTNYYMPQYGGMYHAWTLSDGSPTSIAYNISPFWVAPANGKITKIFTRGRTTTTSGDDLQFFVYKVASADRVSDGDTSVTSSLFLTCTALGITTKNQIFISDDTFSSSNTFNQYDEIYCMVKKPSHSISTSHYFAIDIIGEYT